MLKQIWRSGLIRRATLFLAVSIAVLTPLCWYLRIKSQRDLVAYIGMATGCHRVWFDLTIGRVYEDQSVEDAIAATKPIFVSRHGRYVELGYQRGLSFTGISIIAKDGKLISAQAGSCTWDHNFFGDMSQQDWREISESLASNERTLEIDGR